MELDNMKETWKEQPVATQNKISSEQLIAMIGHPSKSPVASMKRTLKKELYFVVFSFGVASMIFLIAFESKMIGYSIAYLFLTVVFIFYYYFKTKLLNNMQCVTCEVKSNLSLQLTTLEKYIRNNLIISTLVYPAFLLFGAWMLYTNFYNDIPKSFFVYSVAYPAWITTMSWLIFSIVTTVPLYFLNKKYLHWLYGKHINRLKKVLSEMESE